MTFAIKNATSKNFCISISESDRSFSPPCIDVQKNYEITHCKAIGNVSVLASISFESEDFFNKTFFMILLIVTFSLFLISYIINMLIKYLMTEFSAVTLNLFKHEALQNKAKEQVKSGFVLKYSNKIFSALGISSQLDKFKSETSIKLSEYENKFKKEAIEKERFKNLTFSNELYIQKVKQIRHDIRSPLSSIQAAYEAIDKSNAASTAIASAIRRIQILVDDLNQVDKKIEPSKLIIAEVNLEETVMLMQGKFSQAKNAKIIFHTEQNLNPIYVIENDFNRVIENILENALDAISENGVVEITSINKNGKCHITIDDNGVGIPTAIKEHLFSKGATHGKINGIGLGLYHAKKTVQITGG